MTKPENVGSIDQSKQMNRRSTMPAQYTTIIPQQLKESLKGVEARQSSVRSLNDIKSIQNEKQLKD